MSSLTLEYQSCQTPGRGLIQPAFYALRAASVGMIVQPLHSGKIPIPDGWNHRTTPPTAGEIRAWRYGCNYGILTGSNNHNLAVIDGDNPDICAEFERQFSDLAEDTYIVHTRRGKHYYFYCDTLPQTTKIPGLIELMADDLDGNGGKNIVGEGSIHESGHVYEGNGKKIKRVDNLDGPVTWINSLIVKTAPAPRPLMNSTKAADSYGGWLTEEADKIARAPEGQGNATLYTCALKIFGGVLDGCFSEAEARAAIESALSGWTWRKPTDRRAARQTIESAYKRAAPGKNGRKPITDNPHLLLNSAKGDTSIAAPVQNSAQGERLELAPGLFPDGVSDGWRSVCLNAGNGAAGYLELLNEAVAGGMNPQAFTRADLLEHNARRRFPMAERTLQNYTTSLMGVIVQEFPIDSTAVYIGNSCTNPGKAPCIYSIRPLPDIQATLRALARLRSKERHYKEVLARYTPAAMEAIKVKPEYAAEVATALNDASATAFDAQGELNAYASKGLNKKYAQLESWLRDTHSTPLPEDWPHNTDAEFRRAFEQARKRANPGRYSQRDTSAALGITARSATKVVKEAGIKVEAQFESMPVQHVSDLTQQVRSFAGEVKGFPMTIITTKNGGNPYRTAYDPDTAADTIQAYLRGGRAVEIEFRVANKHTVERTTPPEKIVTARPVKVKQALKPVTVQPEKPVIKGHDPAWVKAQLRLGLKLLGWIEEDGRLIDPDTGEIAPNEPLAIVELLTGIQLTQPKIFKEGAWWIQSYPALERVQS